MQTDFSDFSVTPLSFSAKVAIVQASFYEEMGEKLCRYTTQTLHEMNVTDISVFSVPGSLELPAVVSWLQNTGKYDGIIALGIVIKGGTNHYEIVTEESARGLMACSLTSSVPVINGVLGAYSAEDIAERLIKGKSFAKSLGEMMELKKQLTRNI